MSEETKEDLVGWLVGGSDEIVMAEGEVAKESGVEEEVVSDIRLDMAASGSERVVEGSNIVVAEVE